MTSEWADRVFAKLDADSDGKLTPEEITNNFCGQVLRKFVGKPLHSRTRNRCTLEGRVCAESVHRHVFACVCVCVCVCVCTP
jgi:hypothetical protein